MLPHLFEKQLTVLNMVGDMHSTPAAITTDDDDWLTSASATVASEAARGKLWKRSKTSSNIATALKVKKEPDQLTAVAEYIGWSVERVDCIARRAQAHVAWVALVRRALHVRAHIESLQYFTY